MLALLTSMLVLGAQPSLPDDDPSVVFYNARLALRDNRPHEVLRLWLLHNTLRSLDEVSRFEPDFRSLLWASLGATGYCPDGIADDEDGAGLWPVALHNLYVHGLSHGEPPEREDAFDAFALGVQQRFVTLTDVLSADELQGVRFARTDCTAPWLFNSMSGGGFFFEPRDRLQVAHVMRRTLQQALRTLNPNKVRDSEVLDARIFDLDLAITALQERASRRSLSSVKRKARRQGIDASVIDRGHALELGPAQRRVLSECADWPVDAWMALSAKRRAFLFQSARDLPGSRLRAQQLSLQLIDGFAAREDGGEAERWIGFLAADGSPALQAHVYRGARGERLLSLDDAHGFTERSVIALHRGVDFLQQGKLDEALQSLAFASQYAGQSRAAEATAGLARRWMSFALAHFQTDRRVVDILATLVPQADFHAVIEDLIWRAALRGDAASFEVAAEHVRRGTALSRRIEKLRPLVRPRGRGFVAQISEELAEQPRTTLRFLKKWVEHLELEDGDVRLAHRRNLEALRFLVEPLASEHKRRTSLSQLGQKLLDRIAAMEEGLDALHGLASPGPHAPTLDTFAGNIRVAPSDPLPWPFSAPAVRAPSPFTPIRLRPVEWRAEDGRWVFGWRFAE